MKAYFPHFALALGLCTSAAVAAPPPGHLSPDAAMHLLKPKPAPEEYRTGQVLSHIDANEYTYVEISSEGEKLWLAAPLTTLKDGDKVRYSVGVVMKDFYSKVLKRTFPALMFVDSVEPVANR